MSVDAGGVQAASGKAEESADTSVVSVGFSDAAGRRLDVDPRRQMSVRHVLAASSTTRGAAGRPPPSLAVWQAQR